MRTYINCIAIFFLVILSYSSIWAQSPNPEYKQSIIEFQEDLNKSFADSSSSPLTTEDLKKFKALNFYPIDEAYKVEATFVKNEALNTIKMKTSTEREPMYDVYAKATFTFKHKNYTLNLYRSHRLKEKEEYKSYLFLPFNDLTNGEETYGGGRYIDLEIPEGNTIIIDFNKAYNPYCAFNKKYSCPIPPEENFLDVKIKAGIRY